MSHRVDTHMNQQQQLFRDVSYELRSPLARLHLAVGLARKRSEEQVELKLYRIESEAEHLIGLVSEILSLAHLFEAFYRVDPSRQIHQGGFGVGLVISQRIIPEKSSCIMEISALKTIRQAGFVFILICQLQPLNNMFLRVFNG